MRTKLIVFLLLISAPASATLLHQSENFSLELKGYYKNLFFTTKRQTTNTQMYADLNRVRTEWEAKFFKILTANVQWDNDLIAGNFVNSEEFDVLKARNEDPYLNLDYQIARQKDFYYGQSFHRAYMMLDPGPFRLTVGRQRISWGVMSLISPVDLFTPLPTFAVERDEIVGVTAANLEIPVGSILRINPVYEFNSDFNRSRLAGRVTATLGHFDVSILGGKVFRDKVFGFDFSGDIKKAGVKGEFLYDRNVAGEVVFLTAAGMNYGFENSFAFALEYFFDSQGVDKSAGISPFFIPGLRPPEVHRHFLGLVLKYDLTPLWQIFLETIADMDGGSFFMVPQTKYSVFDWLDISLEAHFPFGQRGGEFTATPNLYDVQTQIFF